MKAAVPFEVELTPPLLARLCAKNVASEIAPATSCEVSCPAPGPAANGLPRTLNAAATQFLPASFRLILCNHH
jgi:hypothetical protein